MAVIDTAGKDVGDVEEKGGDDASIIENDSDIAKAIDDETGGSDTDGGAEDKKAGEDSGEKEGDLGEEKAGGDEVKPNELIAQLQTKISELEQKITQPLPPKPEGPPAVPQITEEEWAKYEEERGIPRTAQTWITNTMVRAVQDLQRHIDQRFAKLDRQEALSSLAKDPEFADANKYPNDVNKYLEKVDPRFHSDPMVLKDAVIWSRGMNFKNGVQKVRDEKEINKRISGVARPASSGGGKSPSKSVTLTPIQKSAARAAGWSEDEYAKQLGKGRIIAS